jgi:hypothetical protein
MELAVIPAAGSEYLILIGWLEQAIHKLEAFPPLPTWVIDGFKNPGDFTVYPARNADFPIRPRLL